MTRFAVPLHDLDTLWRTPAGAALVEASLEDADDDAALVTVEGADAVVLSGPEPLVAALVAAFMTSTFPTATARTARVFANDGGGWHRVTTPPAVPVLPDEPATFEVEEALCDG